MPNRREFLKTTALAGAGVSLLGCGSQARLISIPFPSVEPFAQSPILRKFISPLPGLGGSGIPIANADTTTFPGTDFYSLAAVRFRQQMHPDLPNPTTLWGYADQTTGKNAYLGPIIAARRGRPVNLQVKNNLPSKHPLPIDSSLMGADNGAAPNRIAVHLHGGLVPWTMDGGPFSWFAPDGTAGPSFSNGVAGSPGAARYYYPNDQSARLMWYHDHAMGITRLNAYAGLASGYLITDAVVDSLTSGNAPIVPSLAYTIPLVVQDKSFKRAADAWGLPGDLWYPSMYEANDQSRAGRWDLGTPGDGFSRKGLPPTPSAVPEFFADTPVINGEAYPYLQVEPRRYRVLFLNGSQARFFNLNLFYESAFDPGEPDFGNPGPAFIQIGNEGGLLPAPVVLNSPPRLMPQSADGDVDPAGPHNLLLAPAERADLIIDFSSCRPGDKLILYSDAPAPFPSGDLRNDYFTGNRDHTDDGGAKTTKVGQGPNTRTLMQIQVVALKGSADPLDFTATLNALSASSGLPKAYNDSHLPFGEPDLITFGDPSSFPAGALHENKTLNEDFDEFGRLIQRVGAGEKLYADSFARNYTDAPTEVYHNGQTVVWDIYNATGDTHPMHFHLTNVQVIGRAPFTDVGTPDAAFTPPDPNYYGWKETVRMNPGEVTRVAMKFTLPAVPFAVPGSARPGLQGGHEYVWHCHILEHEEHDMMRPLVILP